MTSLLKQKFAIVKKQVSSRLVRNMAGTFGLRLSYTVLAFIMNVLLARFLGRASFGIFIYAFTWFSLLSMLATVGLENLMVREVALYTGQELWGLLRGLLKRADQIVFCVSCGTSIIAIGIAWTTWQSSNWEMFVVFCVAMLGLPFAALRNLRRGTMDGLSQVALGYMSETIIAPILFLIIIIIASLSVSGKISALLAIQIHTFTVIVTFIINSFIRNSSLPKLSKNIPPKFKIKSWLLSAVPFMMLGSLYVIGNRIDIIMVGAIQNVEVSGIYQPVSRGAQLLTFVPASVSRVLAPKIAQTYASGDMKQLQEITTKSARSILILTCPIVIILMLCSHWYLLLFGEEFLPGQPALIILCIGQLVHVAAGVPGILLHMTGYEVHSALTKGTSVFINIILNAILIPYWGIAGAALATAISIGLSGIADFIVVKQKLAINSTVLPG